jgi:hypothetical protein
MVGGKESERERKREREREGENKLFNSMYEI